MRTIVVLSLLSFFFLSLQAPLRESECTSRRTYPQQLSEYGFFVGQLADLQPAAQVFPYTLNTPLFSDYAHKARFVYLPDGQPIRYRDTVVMDFPVGSILIKHFYYYEDERKPEKGRRILETRLLVHEEDGWTALPYVWDDAQEEAWLEVAGETQAISWKDQRGKRRQLDYQIPNVNQCKGCHLRAGDIQPIGPTARQLNGVHTYPEGTYHQIEYWTEQGWLKDAPPTAALPRLVNWQDATTSLDHRARAWLDINCGHCHNPLGPASTSGLFLDFHTQEPTQLGIRKPPVAAGRGAGGHDFDILPGHPDKSILLFRMASTDPGIMMPEIGRQILDKEGYALIEEWISAMEE